MSRLNALIGSPKEVDYGYLNGDPLPIETYSPAQISWESEGLPQGPVNHARFVDNYQSLQPDQNRQVLTDPVTGRRVVVHFTNLDRLEAGEELDAVITTRNSSLDTNGGNRREYALLADERPTAVIDIPGAGLSDKLPRKIKQRLLKTGSFVAASEVVVRALDSAGYHPRSYSGTGLGGRYAIGAAAASRPGQVKHVTVIDPEGQSNLGFWAQQKAFARELLIHLKNARQATTDPYANPHENFPSLPKEWEKDAPLKVTQRYFTRGSLWQQYITYPRVLAHGRLAFRRDIKAAQDKQGNMSFNYISPAKSELLLDADDPIKTIGALAVFNAAKRKSMKVIRVPEATHYFTAAHPRIVRALIKKALS
jgi:hypothetical protein